jgi:hypothetical protein
MRTLAASVGLALALAATSARAQAPKVEVDKTKLVLLSDGKKHYVAVVPFSGDDHRLLYSGDGGRKFFSVPVQGGGWEQGKRFNYSFVDPRHYKYSPQSSIDFVDGKYSVSCGTRTTQLTEVPADEAKPFLNGATFEPSPRKWRPYALVRDEKGIYYFVDHGRTPETEKSFRLFHGPRGNLKQLKMTNVVSDSQGDMFATKSGSLRLILGKSESSWIEKGKNKKLTIVPVDDNIPMIFNELGVYAGERLGTPCDDL